MSLIKKKITCFTISYSNNREVQIAKKCADVQKQKFIYCQLSNDHLIYHFDEAVKICGGFHSFLDAFFIGINNNIVNKNQIAIHGHGLDYFFFKALIYLPSGLNYLVNQLFLKNIGKLKEHWPMTLLEMFRTG